MNKADKILVCIYFFLAVSYGSYVIYNEKQFTNLEFLNRTIHTINEATEKKTVNELSDKTKQIINNLYIKILNRPADLAGLAYYGSELENGKMTINDIQKTISHSEEARLILKPNQWKTVDELNKTTIKIVNESFIKYVGIQPTPEALSYYGSELEAHKISAADMEKILIKSK